MTRVVFLLADGERRECDVKAGWSVMQGAMRAGVPGVEAECGGSMACATCHVFVADAWLAKIAPAAEMEREMLDMLPALQPNSRLSCQVVVRDDLDGLVIEVPAAQINVAL